MKATRDRAADFEGFYFACPSPRSDEWDGWHVSGPLLDECLACGRPIRDAHTSTGLNRWIYDLPFLLIEEEPV